MRLPRRKAEIDYSLALQKIEEALVHHACLFIRGAPGSGKSTLLEQVTKSLQENSKKTMSLRVPRRMDKNVAIHWLAESLQVASKGDEIHLLSLIQEKIESEKTSLCIDDFDKIQNFESLASFFIKSLEEGSLIASSQAYPEVDILIEADAYFYDHAGLSKEQTSELVDRLGLSFESNELFEEFYSHTNGNAFLIRTALSFWRRENFEIKAPLVWDGAEQYLYEKAIVAAEEQLYLDKLKKAALLKYDFTRITSILRKGSPAFIRSLKELRLIEEDQNSLSIKREFRRFINSQLSEKSRSEFTSHLLSEIESDDGDIKSKIDYIFLLISTAQLSKAAEKFSEFGEFFMNSGIHKEIEQMTAPLVGLLPPSSLYYRTNALGCLGKIKQAKSEILKYLDLHKDNKDCSRLLYSAASNAEEKGDRKSAIENLKKIVSLNGQDRFFVIKALTQLAVYLAPFDLEEAHQNLAAAEKILSQTTLDKRSPIQSYIAWAKSKLAWATENRTEALVFIEQAARVERSLDRNYEWLFCKAISMEISTEIGAIETSLRTYHEIKPLVQLYSATQIERPIDCEYAEIQRLLGKLSASEKIFQNQLAPLLNQPLSRNDIQKVMKWLNTGLCTSNFEQIETLKAHVSSFNQDSYLIDEVQAFRIFYSLIQNETKNSLDENLFKLETMPETMKLEVCCWLSEYFFQKKEFPRWFFELEKIVLKIDKKKVIPHHLLQWKINYSFALLLKGYFAKAEKVLDSINFCGNENFYSLFRFRIYLWRAYIGLTQNNSEDINKHIHLAKSLLLEMEQLPEESFLHAICAAAFIRQGEPKKAKLIFEIQRNNDDLQAIKFCLGFMLKKDKPSRNAIRFWTHFFKSCNLKEFESYEVISAKETKQVLKKDLQSKKVRKTHITIHDDSNTCVINQINVDFNKRQVLWRFLKILLENFSKPLSKENICKLIWNENYNPLIHDSRIYTNIANLRKVFSDCDLENILLEKEGSYLLKPDLIFQWTKRQTDDFGLSSRQKVILDYLSKNPSLKRDLAQKLTHSSSATIKRDLKELCDRGFIQIAGIGRASYYELSTRLHQTKSAH